MKEFTKFELAAVRRTAQNVSVYKKKMQNLYAKKTVIDSKIAALQANIDLFEDPIKKLSGGYTTDQILSGEYKLLANMEKEADVVTNLISPEENSEKTDLLQSND